MDKIVFIGLGKMGLPMAENLRASGLDVIGYDINKSARNTFSGFSFDELKKALSHAETVITMLPSGKEVKEVLFADDNFQRTKPGSVLLEMSSSLPQDTKEIKYRLEGRMQVLDAPVSGGVARAKAGELSIMVGGSKELFEKKGHIFDALGQKAFYCGETGTGHAAKALNNYVSAAGLIAACEALVVAKKIGIEEDKFTEILNSSTGKNNTTEKKLKQFILNRAFNSGFALTLMAKDVGIAKLESEEHGMSLKLLSEVSKYLNYSVKSFENDVDHTQIYEFIENFDLRS